ncbi:PREDICTED: TNF receptor-associated factor 6-A-like [Habropoda laboriosa]|uniref:TNF receptor-associated factor 6-A-like n=1 Tax=Habropoda laboriosa TaxID=597456 RepID=UPI00083CEF3C|nr:PREDICTED: TNF receptor-associated factor 6-A-like [Habropoda laboriosa]
MSSTVLLFLLFNTLYLTWCDASDANLSDHYRNETIDEEVTETQHATCKIATEELVASARASVTRVLTGACNAKMLDEKLQALARNLTRELVEIRTLLYTVLEKKRDSRKVGKIYDDRKEMKTSLSYPRQDEIDNFNYTIQHVSSTNGSTSSFFYYWRIKRFDEKLTSWRNGYSERSSTFYVGHNGYAMHLKVTPRFSYGIVLVDAGLTRGRHDSILEWPFRHKIHLSVLDHSFEASRQDRLSRMWDPTRTLCPAYFWGRPKLSGEPDNPECVGLSVSLQDFFTKQPFSIDTTKNSRYLWNGALTVKLTVYL